MRTSERTGVFTSGIVWIFQGRRIPLFFTGCKHAGENLAEMMKQRPADLPPPIQMCDVGGGEKGYQFGGREGAGVGLRSGQRWTQK